MIGRAAERGKAVIDTRTVDHYNYLSSGAIMSSDIIGISPEILAAIISGATGILVAILAGVVSYLKGTSTLKRELDNRLKEIEQTGVQDRQTAEREYQLHAMKAFREAIGGPKGQIVEAVHDLSDRLRRFLSGEQSWDWTEDSGYYRRSFTWLIVRPFVWMEILRQRMVHLDQTLGDLIENEFRFLRHCRLMERAMTETELFRGTGYDTNVASAHVFAGDLRAVMEDFVNTGDPGLACIGYREFDEDKKKTGISRAEDIERIVSNLARSSADSENPDREFRLARLVALYCAANSLLEHFALPYRHSETVCDSIKRLTVIREDFQPPILANLLAMIQVSAPTPAEGNHQA